MTHHALLNNVDHQHLRVCMKHGAAYGDAVNVTLVWPSEFEQLQREYVILFRRRPDGGFRSVALLGLDRDENLYLDGDRWDARYVPAAHARGPFLIREDDANGAHNPKVFIDLDHPRLVFEGNPIFLEHGGNAPALETAIVALQTIRAGNHANEAMFIVLQQLDLLAPVTLNLALGEGRGYDIEDCFVIDGERMRTLDPAALATLYASGFLQPVIWAMSSLGNAPYLISRKHERDASR